MTTTKKSLETLLQIAFFSAFTFLLLFTTPFTPAIAKIKLTYIVPIQDNILKRSFALFATIVSENSKEDLILHRINLTYTSANEIRRNLISGKIDIAPIYSNQLPGIQTTTRMFMFNGPRHIRKFMELNSSRFHEARLHFLSSWYLGTYAFFSDTPLRTPGAFRGKNIAPYKIARIFGANSINLPFIEAKKQFLKGKLDGLQVLISSSNFRDLAERRNSYLTLTNHQFLSSIILINHNRYSSLSKTHKSILNKSAVEVRKLHNNLVVEKENETLNKFQIERADIKAYKDFIRSRQKGIPKNEKRWRQKTAGSTDCPSSKECKCKTDTYGTKCSCDVECKENNDCKDES